VHTALGPPSTAGAIERILGPELAEFYERREAGLLRLESLSQELIEDNEKYRRQLDGQLQADRTRLASELKAQGEQLESAYHAKDAALVEREQAIALEKVALDLRTAQQVRRDNVKGLKSTIAARAKAFQLTQETQRKRWPIHAIFIALLLASAGMAFHGLFWPPPADATGAALWLHVLRIPTGVIGFAFAAVFYIRWNDQWFRQHADEEFRMRQLELDIDRASWITELAIELRDEKGELTAALLDRLSRGLFTGRSSEAVKHPSQDVLAALLGESKRLRLKSPGFEADVSHRGVRRATDRLTEEEE
jgi:hypothetical protein